MSDRIAGKPAPTGFVSCAKWRAGRGIVGAGLPAIAVGQAISMLDVGPNRQQAGSYRFCAMHEMESLARNCRSRLAGDGGGSGDIRVGCQTESPASWLLQGLCNARDGEPDAEL